MNTKGFMVTPALERFAFGQTVQDKAEAIREMFADKSFLKITKTDEFSVGINGLLNTLRNAVNDQERLAALVELVRVSQSTPKLITKYIREEIKLHLEKQLPSFQLLKVPNDRAYIAKACSWIQYPWVGDYAINGMVTEDTGESARLEFGYVVFSNFKNLSEIFLKLQKSAKALQLDTDSPADSMAIRLSRIFSVLRSNITASSLPAGESCGESLASLARIPFLDIGLPSKEERQLGFAREIVLCTYELLRTRFSLATDADTYLPLKVAKRLFTPSKWPKELDKDLNRLENCILEALLLLAKQGITANELVEHLELVVNYQIKADALLRDLADNHPELNESVRSWLRKTKSIQKSEIRKTLIESQDQRTDPIIGQAALESKRISDNISILREQVMSSLELYDPSLVSVLESHVVRTELLLSLVNDLCMRRRLGLFGVIGQEIEFSPKFFDSVSRSAGQFVSVIRPAVVRLDESGLPGEVVVKGLVEAK